MKLNTKTLKKIIDEELEKFIENAYAYGTFSLPSGKPSSPCPQGTTQIGYLEQVDEEGKPLPRCVAQDDGRQVNLEEESDEETFQPALKRRLKQQMTRLLRHGGNKSSGPFKKKAPIDYRGSAPPGASGG